MNTTTTTTLIPAVEVTTDPVLKGDVFYGSFKTNVNGKSLNVIVSNFLKDVSKSYNFRVAAKCQAGFINISDKTGTPHSVIASWNKNSLVSIQVEVVFENGAKHWHNVFTTKGKNWYSIDRGFLEVLTVGDMRQSFPTMCDMKIWEFVGAKTWADKAFTQN